MKHYYQCMIAMYNNTEDAKIKKAIESVISSNMSEDVKDYLIDEVLKKLLHSYRNTVDDLRHFSADINKVVALYTDNKKTANNIDLVLHKDSGRLDCKNFIESKNKRESSADSQKKLLKSLEEELNSADQSRFRSHVFILEGSAPYGTIYKSKSMENIIEYTDMIKLYFYPFEENDFTYFTLNQIIDFLNWKIDYKKNVIDWDIY